MPKPTFLCITLSFAVFLLAACSHSVDPNDIGGQDTHSHAEDQHAGDQPSVLSLPDLNPVDLQGEKLAVLATTSIIGDVVLQVGGEAIDLTVLIEAGQDPHSYIMVASDMALATNADVIFINGWDLEESLAHDLEEGDFSNVIPISADIEPLDFSETGKDFPDDHDDEHEGDHNDEHSHDGPDPHVWFSLSNVSQWVLNVQDVLSTLDSENAAAYKANASAYIAELEDLAEYAETEIARIAPDKRILVTNHDSLSYFANDYGFTILGVLTGSSTTAEMSASLLADLIEEMQEQNLCTIFSETTDNEELARTVADELADCEKVEIVGLFSGALGAEGSGAETFVRMYRYNVDAIVGGLN